MLITNTLKIINSSRLENFKIYVSLKILHLKTRRV